MPEKINVLLEVIVNIMQCGSVWNVHPTPPLGNQLANNLFNNIHDITMVFIGVFVCTNIDEFLKLCDCTSNAVFFIQVFCCLEYCDIVRYLKRTKCILIPENPILFCKYEWLNVLNQFKKITNCITDNVCSYNYALINAGTKSYLKKNKTNFLYFHLHFLLP